MVKVDFSNDHGTRHVLCSGIVFLLIQLPKKRLFLTLPRPSFPAFPSYCPFNAQYIYLTHQSGFLMLEPPIKIETVQYIQG